MFTLIALFILKAGLLLIVMAAGGLFAIYGVALRFVMGLEARPSTIRRFAWLCWGLAIAGVILFIYAGAALAQLVLV